MEREPIRRYPTGVPVSPGLRVRRPGLPRPGHGTVYIHCDGRGTWSANWDDDYPQPDENGATYGQALFEGDGTYEAAETWARTQPAAERVVSYPASALPGTAPDQQPGYVPLPPMS